MAKYYRESRRIGNVEEVSYYSEAEYNERKKADLVVRIIFVWPFKIIFGFPYKIVCFVGKTVFGWISSIFHSSAPIVIKIIGIALLLGVFAAALVFGIYWVYYALTIVLELINTLFK